MEMSCTKVNVIVLGSVTTYLDKYVVLAFFVSLVLAAVTVLLLVKCITYYMQKDRRRIQQNLLVSLPRKPIEEVDDSDSEFNDFWSDSEDVDMDVNELKSVQSERQVQNEKLETNYVNIFSSESNLQNNSDHSYRLLIELKQKSDNALFSVVPNNCLSKTLFPRLYSMGSSEIDFFNFFYGKLTESVWLRKSVVLHLLSFILGLLCEMHFLSRDDSMNLQGKYEQEIEDHSTADLYIDLSFGVAIKNIVNSMSNDLKEADSLIDDKSIENVMHCFYSIHFECLKCLTYEFSVIENVVDNHEHLRIETITDIQCYQLQMKSRVLSIRKYIDTNETDKVKIATIINNYKQKVAVVLEQLDTVFNVELQNLIRLIDKHRIDESDKLLSKHERDFSLLKHEMSKTSQNKGVVETVEAFSGYIILLYKDYVKDKNELIIRLNNQEGMQIKTLYSRQYKAVITKLNEFEGELFLSLQEAFNYTNDRVVSIAKSIENHLKEVKQKCGVIKKHVLNKYIIVVKNWTKFTQIIIDYVIKAVSSEFRCIKSTFKDTLHQIPVFSEDVITSMLNCVQRKFAVIIFDIVVTLVEDIIKTTRQASCDVETDAQRKNFMCNLLDLREDVINDTGSDYVISIDTFNWLVPPQVDLNEFHLEEFLDNYKAMIFSVLNDIVTGIIEEEIEPLQTKITLDHFDKQFEIYQTVQDIICEEENKPTDAEKKNKKYLSRKGTSYHERSKVDKLFETYSSVNGMKETKILELLKTVESRRVSNLLEKDKSGGVVSSCIAILKKQISNDECDLNSDFFVNLFKCEEEYMIKRFSKKLKLFTESDNDDTTTKKKSVSFKSRNTVSPESPPLKANDDEASAKRSKKKVKKSKLL